MFYVLSETRVHDAHLPRRGATLNGRPVVVIGVARRGVGRDNATRRRLSTTGVTNTEGSFFGWSYSGYISPESPSPLGLHFPLVLTEEHTKRLEWQMS